MNNIEQVLSLLKEIQQDTDDSYIQKASEHCHMIMTGCKWHLKFPDK